MTSEFFIIEPPNNYRRKNWVRKGQIERTKERVKEKETGSDRCTDRAERWGKGRAKKKKRKWSKIREGTRYREKINREI